ncbi:hypothetical protein Ciccas_008808 [Cichlidogyrus casuarinus]|uniref:Uncharacterized protein n=1 Tax=Cichlidogyrus casuarinus TaxID=1844966 RepID=A0ABD2PYT8_9PLAT
MQLVSLLLILCVNFPKIHTINPVILIPGYGGTQAYLDIKSLSIFHHLWVNYADFIVPSYFNEHFRADENEDFFVKLKTLIEETYANNNNTRCFIIAHSMGNLYTMDFFNRMTEDWKRTFIRGYAAISPPFAGTVKTFATLAKGENFQVFFVSPLIFRETIRSFPSTHYMLPSRQYWNSSEILVKVIKGGNETNYHAHNLEQFYTDADIADGESIIQSIQSSSGVHPEKQIIHCKS